MPHTRFISDLHLSEQQPHLTALFEHFMQKIAPEAKALYILGDFFDCWFSDRQTSPWIEHIKGLLKTVVEGGTPVYLMVGNRDFLLGEDFAQATGCTLLPDPSLLSLGPHHILLCHGDALCTDDTRYMRYRRVVRSAWVRWLSAHLPLWLVHRIAQHIRNKSIAQHGRRAESNTPIADINETTAAQLCDTHHATHLLHGHTHVAGIHPLTAKKPRFERLILNAWGQQGHYLQWDDDGTYQFKCFGVNSLLN